MIELGKKAKQFELINTEGTTIHLKHLIGKKFTLLLFYPMAFSPLCSDQLHEISTRENEFNEREVTIVAISADLQYSTKAFKEKLGANFIMLSDPKRKVIDEYVGEFDGKAISNRGYVILDKAGIVKYVKVMEDPGKKIEISHLLAEMDNIGSEQEG